LLKFSIMSTLLFDALTLLCSLLSVHFFSLSQLLLCAAALLGAALCARHSSLLQPLQGAAREQELEALIAGRLGSWRASRFLEQLIAASLVDELQPSALLVPATLAALQQHCEHAGVVRHALALLTSLAHLSSSGAAASGSSSSSSSSSCQEREDSSCLWEPAEAGEGSSGGGLHRNGEASPSSSAVRSRHSSSPAAAASGAAPAASGPAAPAAPAAAPLVSLLQPGCLQIVTQAVALHYKDPRVARFGSMALGILITAASTALRSSSSSSSPSSSSARKRAAAAAAAGSQSKQQPMPAPAPLSAPCSASAASSAPASAAAAGSCLLPMSDLCCAADVLLDVLEVQWDRDVQVWALYALLHVAASDEDGVCSGCPEGAAASEKPRGGSLCSHIGARGVLACRAALARFGAGRAALEPAAAAAAAAPSSSSSSSSEPSSSAAASVPPPPAASGSAEPSAASSCPPATPGAAPAAPEPPAPLSGGSAGWAGPSDERVTSVAVLLLGVIVKSTPELWGAVLQSGSFAAVRSAAAAHPAAEKLQEVAAALLSVEEKFVGVTLQAALPSAPSPAPAATGRKGSK
jgi:hypothetical protein